MIDPFFNLSHRFPSLDRRRTGHAANRLPGRLRGVAQVRIGRGERLAFHVLIVADQISTPQQRDEATNRRYRDRRVREFLKELDLVEGCSPGVPKILRAMRNNGWPVPRFETYDDRTLVSRPATGPSVISPGACNAIGVQDNHLENNENSLLTPHDTPQDTPQVTECVERLIGAAQRETSRAELQAAMKPALKAGIIEMTLPDKPTSRNRRYRCTSAGEPLARQLTESNK